MMLQTLECCRGMFAGQRIRSQSAARTSRAFCPNWNPQTHRTSTSATDLQRPLRVGLGQTLRQRIAPACEFSLTITFTSRLMGPVLSATE